MTGRCNNGRADASSIAQDVSSFAGVSSFTKISRLLSASFSTIRESKFPAAVNNITEKQDKKQDSRRKRYDFGANAPELEINVKKRRGIVSPPLTRSCINQAMKHRFFRLLTCSKEKWLQFSWQFQIWNHPHTAQWIIKNGRTRLYKLSKREYGKDSRKRGVSISVSFSCPPGAGPRENGHTVSPTVQNTVNHPSLPERLPEKPAFRSRLPQIL